MNIDCLLKIIQIGFYMTVGIIAILTYLKAKKGLLNSINTEYQKKALIKVEEISNYLMDEYDEDSEHHWTKQKDVEECINKMFVVYEESTEAAKNEKEWFGGIPDNLTSRRLRNWLEKVKSDPFVPKSIRQTVTEYLEDRVDKMLEIHLEELKKFGDELVANPKKYLKKDKGHIVAVISNRIVDSQYKSGCGISQVEKKVHELRFEIQKYYEKYDPFK